MPIKNKYFILILIVILAAAGFLIWQDFQKTKKTTQEEIGSKNPASPAKAGEKIATSTAEKQSAGQAKETADYFKIRMPSLDKEIVVKGNFTEVQKADLIQQIKDASELLKGNFDYYQGWLHLGLLKKAIEDYQGAEESWKFAALIRPKEFLAFNNLGVLYHFYLKDYSKAEENFLKAIENKPGEMMVYQNLHELYRFSYQEKADLADDILLQALKQDPKNIGVLTTLGQYYQEIGDKEKAKTYYEKALVLDPLNEAIQTELNRF